MEKSALQDQEAIPPGIPWFIFTSYGGGFCVTAETITKAVADWKRARHKDAGEIVGIIRGAQENAVIGAIKPTPCFGVIVCVQDSQSKRPAS